MKRTELRRKRPFRPSSSAGSSLPVRTLPVRTGLSRTPARTGGGETRGRKTGAATGRPRPPGEFTGKVKLAVRRRAGRGDVFQAACEGCWRWLGRHGGEYQHRASRGSGGCRDEVVNGISNCLLLCHGCHSGAEERRRDLSQDGAGFWIMHGTGPDYDPRLTPVLLGALGDHGVMAWLASDGLGDDGTGYLFQPPQEVAA